MTQKIAYLDCAAGISAHMFLAALCDAGLALSALQRELEALPLQGYQLQLNAFHDKGIGGSRVDILVEEAVQSVQYLSDITPLLYASTLPSHVQATTLAVFRKIAEAQASIDGSRVETVHLHEAGTLPMLIAIVGGVLGVDMLGITQLYSSPLPLTNGHIMTPSGLQPVPTPVTLELLRAVAAPWKPCALPKELVTLSGAALLATLARFDVSPIAIERIGYGFGNETLPWPHCLRLCLGQALEDRTTERGGADTDWVAVIETHIDNMSGELLGGLMERLFAEGALDVSYTPLQMKKNRPATLVTVISQPEDGEKMALALLRETSTLGVRMQHIQRLKAQRAQQTIETALGPVIVKVKRLGTRIVSAAPEYEECQRIARAQQLPLSDVYEVVQQAIQNAIL